MELEIKKGKEIYDNLQIISNEEISNRNNFEENQNSCDLELATQEEQYVSFESMKCENLNELAELFFKISELIKLPLQSLDLKLKTRDK